MAAGRFMRQGDLLTTILLALYSMSGCFLVMDYKILLPNANITCILRDSLIARRNGLSMQFLFLVSVFSSDRSWARWRSVDNSDSRSTDQGSIAEKHRQVRVLTLF